jgi:hypothetical protein
VHLLLVRVTRSKFNPSEPSNTRNQWRVLFNPCSTGLHRYSRNVATELWGHMLVPLRLSCVDHLRVISAQHRTGAKQTMRTKESVEQNTVIRTLEPMMQQTADNLFPTVRSDQPAAYRQKCEVATSVLISILMWIFQNRQGAFVRTSNHKLRIMSLALIYRNQFG